MSLQDLETKTSDFINTNYPSELWIRVYTDGSAEESVRNGGGGVLIEWLLLDQLISWRDVAS